MINSLDKTKLDKIYSHQYTRNKVSTSRRNLVKISRIDRWQKKLLVIGSGFGGLSCISKIKS